MAVLSPLRVRQFLPPPPQQDPSPTDPPPTDSPIDTGESTPAATQSAATDPPPEPTTSSPPLSDPLLPTTSPLISSPIDELPSPTTSAGGNTDVASVPTAQAGFPTTTQAGFPTTTSATDNFGHGGNGRMHGTATPQNASQGSGSITSSSNKSDAGAIAGGVIGGLLGLIALGLLGWFIYRRYIRPRQQERLGRLESNDTWSQKKFDTSRLIPNFKIGALPSFPKFGRKPIVPQFEEVKAIVPPPPAKEAPVKATPDIRVIGAPVNVTNAPTAFRNSAFNNPRPAPGVPESEEARAYVNPRPAPIPASLEKVMKAITRNTPTPPPLLPIVPPPVSREVIPVSSTDSESPSLPPPRGSTSSPPPAIRVVTSGPGPTQIARARLSVMNAMSPYSPVIPLVTPIEDPSLFVSYRASEQFISRGTSSPKTLYDVSVLSRNSSKASSHGSRSVYSMAFGSRADSIDPFMLVPPPLPQKPDYLPPSPVPSLPKESLRAPAEGSGKKKNRRATVISIA